MKQVSNYPPMSPPPMSPPPMSPPPPGVDYYNAPQRGRRPTSVTVIAIFGIILGSLGVLCGPFALLPFVFKFGPPNPAIDAMRSDTVFITILVVNGIISWVLALIELVSSIGSLTLKPWARKGMLVYATAAIAFGVIGLILSLTWITPRMAAAQPNNPGGAIGSYVGAVVGGAVGVALPICILIFFRKREVIDAFEQPR